MLLCAVTVCAGSSAKTLLRRRVHGLVVHNRSQHRFGTPNLCLCPGKKPSIVVVAENPILDLDRAAAAVVGAAAAEQQAAAPVEAVVAEEKAAAAVEAFDCLPVTPVEASD